MDELIRQAIGGRRVVSFRYNGQRRIGEPHVYGAINGRPHLLLYQTSGSSMNGPYPRWRRCEVSSISHFVITARTFEAARVSGGSVLAEWDTVWLAVGG